MEFSIHANEHDTQPRPTLSRLLFLHNVTPSSSSGSVTQAAPQTRRELSFLEGKSNPNECGSHIMAWLTFPLNNGPWEL
jgi:hypothetical protein